MRKLYPLRCVRYRTTLTDVRVSARAHSRAFRSRALERDAFTGWTPLHCAAAHGHLAIVKLLLEDGFCDVSPTAHVRYAEHVSDVLVQVNDQDPLEGMTPLHLAARSGFVRVVALLVKVSSRLGLGATRACCSPCMACAAFDIIVRCGPNYAEQSQLHCLDDCV